MAFEGSVQIPTLSKSVVPYLAMVAFVACCSDIMVKGRLHIDALAVCVLVFMALVLLSCVWSIAPAASRTEVMRFGGYLMTALAIAVTPRKIAAKKRLAWAVVLGGVAASVLALASSLAQGGFVRAALVGAAGAIDPNNFAASLLLPLALAASGRNTRWPLRLLLCGILVGGVLATGSRGGVIGVLIVLAVALTWGRKRKAVLRGVLKMLIVMVVIWVVVVTLFPVLLTRLSYVVVQDERLEIWPVGLKAFGRFGSIGAGFASFSTAYDAVGAGPAGYSRGAHNIFLQIGVELGVSGLVLFCLCMVLALKRVKSSQAGTAAILGVLAIGFFLGILEFSFFWVTLTFPFLESDSVVIHSGESIDFDRSLERPRVRACQHESH
jgi:O-antigen ligase